MKKKLMMALSLVLVAALSIGGTIAYLTATTEAVTNTFTVGNITATLTENFNVDKDPNKEGNDAWVGKIVPGGKDSKEPIITIGQGSEKCYVYVCVTNTVELSGIIVATPNISQSDWTAVKSENGKTLYRYKEVVDASTASVPVTVFTEVAYANTIAATDIEGLATKSITVQGFAHQSDNIEQSVADNAALEKFGFAPAA